MNPRAKREPDHAVDAAAAEWLCERAEGFTVERAQAFAEWSARDSRHSAAIRRVERALALLDEMPAVRTPLEARFGRVEVRAPRRGRFVHFPHAAWLSAAAAVIVMGAVAWWKVAEQPAVTERFATDAAAQRRVALRDGSVLDLNAASDVRVAFNPRERRISLNAGEAHFQVAADQSRPFVVEVGDVSVRALGTAFNVRLAAETVEVLVLEGKVEVVRADTRAHLVAGDRTHVSRAGAVAPPKIEKAAPAAIRAALAWHDPLTTFNNAPLREVVKRLNQRNANQLVLEDAHLGDRKIGGVIALDQVEVFLRLLEQDGDIAVERGVAEVRLRRAR